MGSMQKKSPRPLLRKAPQRPQIHVVVAVRRTFTAQAMGAGDVLLVPWGLSDRGVAEILEGDAKVAIIHGEAIVNAREGLHKHKVAVSW